MWQKQGQIYLQPLLLIEYKWKKHPTERFAPQMWCHFFEGQGKTVEKASKRWKFSVRQKRSEKWLTWGDSQFFFFCLLPLPPENRIQTNQKNTWRSYWELALKWPSINWFLLVFIAWVKFYVCLTNKTKTSLSENITSMISTQKLRILYWKIFYWLPLFGPIHTLDLIFDNLPLGRSVTLLKLKKMFSYSVHPC